MAKSILNSLSGYLTVFSLLGLSPNINKGNAWGETYNRLTIVLFIAFFLTLDLICIIVLMSPSFNDNIPLEVMMGNVFVFSDVLKIIAISIQSYMHRYTLSSILHGFEYINGLFVNLEQRTIDYRLFRKPFTIKCIVMVICYVLHVAVFAILRIPRQNGFWHVVIFKLWNLSTMIMFIHAMFYIDLLRIYLQQMNLNIRNDNIQGHRSENVKCRHTTKKMMKIKVIHFKLWEITQEINATFGWTILALLFQQFINSTYSMYWLIFIMVQHEDHIHALREFSNIIKIG